MMIREIICLASIFINIKVVDVFAFNCEKFDVKDL